MSALDRRRLLLLGAGALAASRLGAQQDPVERACELQGAIDAARASGRPLVVLLFEEPEGRERASSWGAHAPSQSTHSQFLHYADDSSLALLAACELVCATPSELLRHAPGARIESAWMAVLEDDRVTPVRATLRAPTPVWELEAELSKQAQEKGFAWAHEEANTRHQAQVEERARALGAALRAALYDDPRARARWSARCSEVLGPERQARLRTELATGRMPAVPLLRAGAPLTLSRALSGAPWPELTAALVDLARERHVRHAPHGALWATNRGCGSFSLDDPPRGEQAPTVGYLCGMGHTPESARHFLYFYTRTHARGCADRASDD